MPKNMHLIQAYKRKGREIKSSNG